MVTAAEREQGKPGRALSARRSDALLLAATAIETMGHGAIFALLADLKSEYDLTAQGIGVIAATSFFAALISQIAIARYADRGHSRLMLRLGLAIAGIGMLGFGLSGELWQLVLMRLLLGLGSGAFMSASRRVLVMRDLSRTGEILGRLTAVEVAGFIAGPPIAAVLASTFGLRAPFIVLAGALALTAPAVARIVEPPAEISTEKRTLRVLLGNRAVLAGVAVGAAWALSMGVFDAVWAVFMKDRGASTNFVGFSLAVFAFPLVLFSAAGGRLADRVGPVRAAVFSMTITVPVMLLYGFTDNIWILCVIALVHSGIDTVTMPAARIAVARAAPPELLASGQGLSGGVGALVGGLASLAAAPIYDGAGALAVWGAGAGGIGLLTLLAAWWGRGYAPAPPRPADPSGGGAQ
ncbi:MAG: MFS transporter [Acidimicrobiia bacterium]|nr:MFS transporter [Acidimicrobiia bacterium]